MTLTIRGAALTILITPAAAPMTRITRGAIPITLTIPAAALMIRSFLRAPAVTIILPGRTILRGRMKPKNLPMGQLLPNTIFSAATPESMVKTWQIRKLRSLMP